MEAKKTELKRNKEELQDISREISHFSGEIEKKRREVLHQKSLLQNLNSSIEIVAVNFKSCKRKNAFQISACIQKEKQKKRKTKNKKNKKTRIINPNNIQLHCVQN